MAGNPSLTTRAQRWLQDWLDGTYDAWPWPFLKRRASGVTVAAGTQSILFGNNGTTAYTADCVRRVLSPIVVYNSDYTITNWRLPVRSSDADPVNNTDEYANDPSTNRGLPTAVKVRAKPAGGWGQWELFIRPVPDRSLIFAIDYLVRPDALGASDIPLYPADRTLIQCVYAHALKFDRKEETADAMEDLGAMAIQDRLRYGTVDGTNDHLDLDASVFR